MWRIATSLPSFLGGVPKAPGRYMVYAWALKGLPYHDFGVYVHTIQLHRAVGTSPGDSGNHI